MKLILPLLAAFAFVGGISATCLADDDFEQRWKEIRGWFENDDEKDRQKAREEKARAEQQAQQQAQEEANRDGRQTVRGRVIGLERLSAGYGDPESLDLKVRMDNRRDLAVHLGDLALPGEALPRLIKGSRVKMHGDYVTAGGKTYFKAREIRAQADGFLTPEFLRDRRMLQGTLQDIQRAKMRGDDIDAVVVQVRNDKGQIQDVLLGHGDELDDTGKWIVLGTTVEVDGYTRRSKDDGRVMFVAGEVRSEAQLAARGQDQVFGVERDRPATRTPIEKVTLRGQVDRAARLDVDSPPYDHNVVELRFTDGQSRIVDLGTETTLSDLDIDPGETVQIEGRRGYSHGRRVVMVDRIQVNGRWHTINSSAEHEAEE